MMGRTTLREIKEAPAAARLGAATTVAAELELLIRAIERETGSSSADGVSVGIPPNDSTQQPAGQGDAVVRSRT